MLAILSQTGTLLGFGLTWIQAIARFHRHRDCRRPPEVTLSEQRASLQGGMRVLHPLVHLCNVRIRKMPG